MNKYKKRTIFNLRKKLYLLWLQQQYSKLITLLMMMVIPLECGFVQCDVQRYFQNDVLLRCDVLLRYDVLLHYDVLTHYDVLIRYDVRLSNSKRIPLKIKFKQLLIIILIENWFFFVLLLTCKHIANTSNKIANFILKYDFFLLVFHLI